MSRYYDFSRTKFEYELRGILIRNKLGNVYDITQTMLDRGYEIWERVYFIPTRNKAVSILIYSSIDLRTDRVREKGSDAIRVVLAWRTKRGIYYKSFAKHLRTRGIFQNLEKTLKKINESVFQLDFREFVKELKV